MTGNAGVFAKQLQCSFIPTKIIILQLSLWICMPGLFDSMWSIISIAVVY